MLDGPILVPDGRLVKLIDMQVALVDPVKFLVLKLRLVEP